MKTIKILLIFIITAVLLYGCGNKKKELYDQMTRPNFDQSSVQMDNFSIRNENVGLSHAQIYVSFQVKYLKPIPRNARFQFEEIEYEVAILDENGKILVHGLAHAKEVETIVSSSPIQIDWDDSSPVNLRKMTAKVTNIQPKYIEVDFSQAKISE